MRKALRMMRRLVHRAVRSPYVWARLIATDLLFERRYGVRTSGEVTMEDLGLASEGREQYQPVGWRRLHQALPRASVGPDDVFLDLGCGMGRGVLLASGYPFRRVIGVELSARLADLARENMQRSRAPRRCGGIEIVTSDVLDYDIPDDVTVVFLNNPFGGHVFARVMEKLVDSLERHPRPMRIVYGNPVEEAMLLDTGRFELVRVVRGLRPSAEWARSNSVRVYGAVTR